MSGTAVETRFCPICGVTTGQTTCAEDGVPTVPRGLVERDVPLETGGPVGGRWSLVTRLGAGGMADVYRARDADTGDEVAIKLLRPSLSRDPHALQRFYREAAILERLEGPAFPRVHALGFDDDRGSAFLTMTLVRGQRLTELCPVRWRDATRICAAVARALGVAHTQGIVHRDLKPDNVLVEPSDDGWRVTVMDFGVARRLDEHDPTLTETGAPVGTPSCMAPEQIEGREVDARTDLYALGCLLHRALTGQRLFETDSTEAMLRHHLITTPPPLSPHPRPDGDAFPAALIALRDRLVAKHPDDRPASADWVAEAFDAIADGLVPDGLAPLERGLSEPTHPGTRPTKAHPGSAHANSSTDRPRSGARVWVAAIGLISTAAVVWIVTSPSSPWRPGPPTPIRAEAVSALAAPAQSPPVSPVTRVDRVAEVHPAGLPAPPTPTAPSKHVTIIAEPTATVYRGTTRLGKTPLALEVPAGPPVEVWLRREGHLRERLRLDERSPSQVKVTLSRSRAVSESERPEPAPDTWSPQPF